MSDQAYTIRQMSEEFDVTARTLRFYEDKGLLSPHRQGQTRLYHGRDRARMVLILRGKRLGFALDEIREMLDLYDTRDGKIAQLKASIVKHRERIGILKEQRRDIDLALNELQDLCVMMENLLEEKMAVKEKEDSISPSATGYAGSSGPVKAFISDDDQVTEMVTNDDYV